MSYIKKLFKRNVKAKSQNIEDISFKAAKSMLPLILKKYKGTHPTKSEMINFVKKYREVLSYKIVREYTDDNPFYDQENPEIESPCSYFQYIVISIKSPYISPMTSMSISSLPWKEIVDLFGITEDDAKNKWVPEYPEDEEDGKDGEDYDNESYENYDNENYEDYDKEDGFYKDDVPDDIFDDDKDDLFESSND